jgi:anti-anti-sigma regulatory factor
VTHIDSTGLGSSSCRPAKLKQAGGELRLAGANKHVEQVLKLTSVDKLVAWNPTVTEAAVRF